MLLHGRRTHMHTYTPRRITSYMCTLASKQKLTPARAKAKAKKGKKGGVKKPTKKKKGGCFFHILYLHIYTHTYIYVCIYI